MKTERETWMIQVQFDDKDLVECPIYLFRRELQGSGVEVDASYTPVHVGRGRFVGRGTATPRAARRLHSGIRFANAPRRRFDHVDLFKVFRFEEKKEDLPQLPIPTDLHA